MRDELDLVEFVQAQLQAKGVSEEKIYDEALNPKMEYGKGGPLNRTNMNFAP
jgi:hypothetical protein